MIDSDGFRANVGIILTNHKNQVFWAKTVGKDIWQFPQGGINLDETPESAMYRELEEETGLKAEHVAIISSTNDWLRYLIPKQLIRYNSLPLCIGQKQIWYLLKLLVSDNHVNLKFSDKPEFDLWKWVYFWNSLDEVVSFKRENYEKALKQFIPYLGYNPELYF